AARWVNGVGDAVDLEAVGFVLADTVLDDAVGGSVERERLVTVRTIVDPAAAATCSVTHGVGVAPPDRHEPRAPDAEGVTVEEVSFALLEQHVRAVLDGEHVRVLLPIVVGTEKALERDLMNLGETNRVAADLRPLGILACPPQALDLPPAAPFHRQARFVTIRLEQGPSFVLRADDDRPTWGAVRGVPVRAAVHVEQPGRLRGV